MAKKGLGRGLNALLQSDEPISSEANVQGKETVSELKIIDIEPNTGQPRKDFDDEKISELADSIKEHGVITPILVQKSENGFYKIIAGERRWRASKLAGKKTIPAIIKDYDKEEFYEVSLIENLQRQDLNPVEEALGYKKLMDEFGFTQEEVAKKLSKSRSSIANSLRLLNLEKEVMELLSDGKISTGHAKVLLGLSDKKRQIALSKEVAEKELSVRELESLIKAASKKPKKEIKKDLNLRLAFENAEKRFSDIFSTKVQIVDKKGKGKITIDYYSKEDLDRITKLLEKIKK